MTFNVISIEQELTILFIALLFDGATRLLLPDFRDRMAPLGGVVAGVAQFMHRKLNRDYRESGILIVRGFIAFVFLLVLSCGAAYVLDMMVKSHPRGKILAVLVVFSCLRLTFPWTLAIQALPLLKQKKPLILDLRAILKRRRVMIGDTPLKNADQHTIARIIIDTVGRSFGYGFMSVAFWYCVPALLGYSGLIFMLMAVAIREMKRVITGAQQQESAFATPFKALDTVVHFIPVRVATILLWLAMFFTPKTNPFSALKCVVTQAHRHVSVNAGWPVALLAGGLGLALPSYNSKQPWIGSDKATAKATAHDVRYALHLHYVAFILVVLLLSVALFLTLGM